MYVINSQETTASVQHLPCCFIVTFYYRHIGAIKGGGIGAYLMDINIWFLFVIMKEKKETDNVRGLWRYFGRQGSGNKSHVHFLSMRCRLIGSWSTSKARMGMKSKLNRQDKRLATVSEEVDG